MKQAKGSRKRGQATPSLPEITAGIRQTQAALVAENERLQKAVGRWSTARKYSAVEIGWQLLRAILLHRSDTHTRFKPFSTGVENVSTPKPQALTTAPTENAGFYKWLADAHPDIEPRTARNYMNAARNAGLSAESTLAQVAALRKQDKLAGLALAKLYRAVQGDEDPAPSLADQMQAKRLMAELKWTHGRSGLLHQIHEFTIENPVFAELPPEVIERIYFKLTEAAEKVDEYRPSKGQQRRAA